MLESVKISRRQSEIRQALAELVGKPELTEDETRSMEALDKEYRQNETRYRAALITEDEERREAGADLENRSDREYAELIDQFELRQVALFLDEGRQLDGPTAEVVQELRSQGGYRGIPVPWQALERRAGETIASGTPDPVQTRPIIDRLFPQSAAARMGAQMINIDHGEIEWPVTTQGATTGWQATETGDVGAAQAYQTTDKPLAPNNTLGTQMTITRKTLKQSGAALESAVRRDMNSAIGAAMDKAVFLGAGASGEPEGVLTNSSYGITETAVSAAASWAAFRAAVVRFLTANAASSPDMVKLLIRPEVWDALDDTIFDAGSGITEWDRLVKHIPASNITMSSNALDAPAGSPAESSALLTVTVGGVAPIFIGTWGAVDLIRDPYTKAASGALVLTALATMDVTVARPAQLEILTGIQ
ncbi:phage major capsid protein [Chelativorans sp. SCAU2101]|uniref:Phage major capsid protein n=1 Tax=Chelativorans petroleitrophicus TaxID=2975484 RepID=A0A9X3AYU1_9HYPH|nr:phage major capsid protein [Chelativorans petroleitrophicus]MCT8989015.1 phage major capsid protein [Chelativorans petroleitrophicus]